MAARIFLPSQRLVAIVLPLLALGTCPLSATALPPVRDPTDHVNNHFSGTVKEIGKDYIIIDGTGGANGNGPPMLGKHFFELSANMVAGKLGDRATGAFGYRISDVKLGDKVDICFDSKNMILTCKMICIQRRPGGRVPPSPTDKPDDELKWHERVNAYQDFEEKGIPLPPKYDPVHQEALRKQILENIKKLKKELEEMEKRKSSN